MLNKFFIIKNRALRISKIKVLSIILLSVKNFLLCLLERNHFIRGIIYDQNLSLNNFWMLHYKALCTEIVLLNILNWNGVLFIFR